MLVAGNGNIWITNLQNEVAVLRGFFIVLAAMDIANLCPCDRRGAVGPHNLVPRWDGSVNTVPLLIEINVYFFRNAEYIILGHINIHMISGDIIRFLGIVCRLRRKSRCRHHYKQ